MLKDNFDDDKEKFNLLYKEIYNENLKIKFDKIEKKKKKEEYINLFLIFILPFIYWELGRYLLVCYNLQDYSTSFIIVGFIMWIILIRFRSKPINQKSEAVNLFNKEIITPLIQDVLPQSNYEPDIGMNENEYSNCNWEKFDTFYSGGKIVAPLKLNSREDKKTTLELYEVLTEKTISYGNEHSIVSCFEGLCCFVKLPKNMQMYTKVINNEKENKVKENGLVTDMPEFENKFNVETNNTIKTNKILTSDVMLRLIEFINTSEIGIDLYINNDNMYMRFHTTEILFERKFNKKRLKEGYDTLKIIKNIVEYISSIIINVDE